MDHRPDYAARLHAFCSRCARPHGGSPGIGADERACFQGSSCACSFNATGRMGRAHYGSVRDDSCLAPAQAWRQDFAEVDPLCDACLGELCLRGRLFDLGAPVEFAGPSIRAEGDQEARRLARAHAERMADMMAGRRAAGR